MRGKGQRWKGEGGAARLPARRARALAAAAGGSPSASPPRTQDKIPSHGTVYVHGQKSKPNVREMAEMRTQPLPKLNPLCEPYVRTPFSSSNQGSRVEGAATDRPGTCQVPDSTAGPPGVRTVC